MPEGGRCPLPSILVWGSCMRCLSVTRLQTPACGIWNDEDTEHGRGRAGLSVPEDVPQTGVVGVPTRGSRKGAEII